MKVYMHIGVGFWGMGSNITVISESKERATVMILEELIKIGLKDEQLNITEYPIIESLLISDNGDY